ncbi:MAG: hypothetical protein QF886_25340, partial [Planctomycetota bacterium]|nr:hypothetical protein [Planctomycetota bacterium]
LLQSADPEFIQEGNKPIQRMPKNREELFPYDVIVFTDANFREFDEEQVDALQAFVEELGGGIFFGAGPHHRLDGLKGSRLARLLPIVPPLNGHGRDGPVTESFQIKLTDEGIVHPILKLETESPNNYQRWKEMPGLYWYLPVMDAKPGALKLAVHPFERNDNGNHVILAAQIYGAGRTIFLASTSTWRWRYLAGDMLFYRFWGQSIRFLSAGRLLGQNKRVSLLTDRKSYQLGEQVVISARILDELFRPVEKSEVEVEARGPSEEPVKIVLANIPKRPGVFQGSFRPGEAGNFQVGFADREIDAVGRAFSVAVPALEFEHPELNESLLMRISSISSGDYYPFTKIEEVPGRIAQIRENIVTESADDLWDSPFLLLLLTTFLAAEWILRKKRMMI